MRSDKRKIFMSTDGLINNKPHLRKKRRYAAIHSRCSDGAISLVKIYGKKDRSGKNFINGLVLSPENHSSLDEESIVGKREYFGIKIDKETYFPIYSRDLTRTDDKLSRKEYRYIKKNIQNDSPRYRLTYKRFLKKWKKRNFK